MRGALHLLIVITESTYPNIASRNFQVVVEHSVLGFERIIVWAAEICQSHLVELPSEISIIHRSKTVASVSSGEPTYLTPIISLSAFRAGMF